MPEPVSGTDHTIRAAGYEAHIASVGATLRSLAKDAVDVVTPFAMDEMRPGMSGALLAPWPNRLADGRYRFRGAGHQLPINEPELRNAAHGLVAWLDFDLVDRSAHRVDLRGSLAPQPGYPWRLTVDVAFAVSGHGLTQEVAIVNEGPSPAPIGMGGHPYLLAGASTRGSVDSWIVHVPAEEVVLVSQDRLLPTGSVAVADTPDLDFRHPRVVGDSAVNNAYTRLERDADGLARVTVTDRTGAGIEIAWDARCPWVQVYTSDAAEGAAFRSAVAVEPMTCPPDAFNSCRDLSMIEPGASLTAGWTIRAV